MRIEISGNTLIFIMVVLFLFLSSPGNDGISSQYELTQLKRMKAQYRSEYNSFSSMKSDENFKNITGWKLSYQDSLDKPDRNATYPIDGKDYDNWAPNQKYTLLPDELIETVNSDIWNRSDTDISNIFPPNITSSLSGKIEMIDNNKYNRISMPVPRFYLPPNNFAELIPPNGEANIVDLPSHEPLRNVTFKKGDISIQILHVNKLRSRTRSSRKRFNNDQDDKWKLLDLEIDFADRSEKEKYSISAAGIYDIQRGRILTMSQSSKFHSLFAFPHYMSLQDGKDSDVIYDEVKHLIGEFWNASSFIDMLNMRSVRDSFDSSFKCEFMGFFQLAPWNQYTKEQLHLVDEELAWPLGRPANLTSLPPINIESGLLYSPDCGIRLQFENVEGERYELKMKWVRYHLLCGMILFAAQIYLLLCQMQHTNTPSAVNKISFYCFSMINLVDGSLATLYFIAAGIKPELYLPLVISAFSCFILASIFETRYLTSIYASQINEQRVSILTLLRGSNLNDSTERPMVIPDEASIGGALYGRFFFTLILFTFLILSSTSWPRQIRLIFEYITIFVLNSYWIPQIFRNAVKGIPSRRVRRRNMNQRNRNQRKMPLLWKFIIGTTVIRVLPVIYVFSYSSNIFGHHRDIYFVIYLSLWLLFQIIILYSQDILGSRWFLPQHTIPDQYSYFKPITEQQLKDHGGSENHTLDCPICMTEVPIYVKEIPETHGVDQEGYMVTPCGHVFHKTCLENWMSYKLQCPVCRTPLPPL